MFQSPRFVFGVLAAAALTLSVSGPAQAQAATKTAPQGVKNVVLVHGAFADGSSWAKVIPLLEAKGLRVTVVQNPLTSLAADVAATKRALALQDGPVLLVGHSWGGMVITEAGTDPKVAGLAYVAAAAPDAGQSFGELTANAPTPGVKELKPDAEGFLSLTDKGVNEYFAPDLSAPERLVVRAVQQPLAAATLGEKTTAAAWQTKPSWYVVASDDRMISPDLERALAQKIKATTLTLKSSHVPMLSQPDKVAAFLVEAARKAGAK